MRTRWIGLACVLGASSAWAQTPCAAQSSVDRLEREANRLRQRGRDREALTLLENAWNLCPSGRAMVRRGLAEWALEQWLAAEAHVLEGLRDTRDPWIQANRAAIEREDLPVIQSHLGSIELRGATGQGEVQIDGRRVCVWPPPGPIRVVAGPVNLSVIVDGRTVLRSTLTVAGGATVRHELDPTTASTPATPPLAPTPQPTPQPAHAPSPPPETLVAQGPQGAAPTELPVRSGAAQRAFGWVAIGLSAVAAGVGVGASVSLVQRDHAYRNEPGCVSDVTAAATPVCMTLRSDAEAAHNDMPALQVAGFVGGAALLAAGVVLLVTAPSNTARRHALRCAEGPGTFGLACGVSF